MEQQQRSHAGEPLDARRLAAAVKAVVARYEPDQVILFGSAARGTMTEESDIDLLLIKADYKGKSHLDRRSLRIDGNRLDILTMSPEEAERQPPST